MGRSLVVSVAPFLSFLCTVSLLILSVTKSLESCTLPQQLPSIEFLPIETTFSIEFLPIETTCHIMDNIQQMYALLFLVIKETTALTNDRSNLNIPQLSACTPHILSKTSFLPCYCQTVCNLGRESAALRTLCTVIKWWMFTIISSPPAPRTVRRRRALWSLIPRFGILLALASPVLDMSHQRGVFPSISHLQRTAIRNKAILLHVKQDMASQ